MLKKCSMSGRTPGNGTLQVSPRGYPIPGRWFLRTPLRLAPTGHGEAVHVVQEVDVAQHTYDESRPGRRQAGDALQPLLIWHLGLSGLWVSQGPRQAQGARHWPIIWVICLAEEGRGVRPGHSPGEPHRPALRSHQRSHLRSKGAGEERLAGFPERDKSPQLGRTSLLCGARLKRDRAGHSLPHTERRGLWDPGDTDEMEGAAPPPTVRPSLLAGARSLSLSAGAAPWRLPCC